MGMVSDFFQGLYCATKKDQEMSKKVYNKMTNQEDVFETNSSMLDCFEKNNIDKNQSENVSKEINQVCKISISNCKNEQEVSRSDGWNIVKKQNIRKTKMEKKDSKALVKLAKIPCRNYPGCNWKKGLLVFP